MKRQANVTSTSACEHDLRRRVVSFLTSRGVLGSPSLEVAVEDGTVVVRGKLPSQQSKRLCLECCRHVAGVTTVVDEVSVETQSPDRAVKPR
jgi:osmotically-inducible protein OsmY